MAMNFGVFALAARWAGQESLGIIIALNGAAFLGGVVCSLGLPTLLLKSVTGHLMVGDVAVAAGHYRRAVLITVRASVLILAILGLVALGQKVALLPAAFGSMGPVELLAAGACSLGMALQFVGLSAFRAMKRPALSGFFQFCTQPLLLLGVLGVMRIVLIDISRSYATVALTASILLNAVLVHQIVHRKLPPVSGTIIEGIAWGEARSMWFLGMLSSASGNIPILLGAILLASSEVAVLGVPFRICNLPMTVVSAMGAYYAPYIREAHLQKNEARQRKQLTESQWIGVALVIPVLLLALIFPNWLLGLFRIHELAAVRLLVVFAVAQVLIAGCGVCEQYLAMLGASALAARYTLIFFAAILFSGAFLTHMYGAMGGGVAWAIFAVARQFALRRACNRFSTKLA